MLLWESTPLTTRTGKQPLIKTIRVWVSCNPNSQVLSHCDLCLRGQRRGGGGVERGWEEWMAAVRTETNKQYSLWGGNAFRQNGNGGGLTRQILLTAPQVSHVP